MDSELVRPIVWACVGLALLGACDAASPASAGGRGGTGGILVTQPMSRVTRSQERLILPHEWFILAYER